MSNYIGIVTSNRGALRNAICLLLTGSAVASVAPYQSIIALETLKLSPQMYSAFLIVVSVVSLVFSMALGALSDRLNSRYGIMLVAAICGLLGHVAMLVDFGTITFVVVHAILLPFAATLFQQFFASIRQFASAMSKGDAELITSASRTLIAGSYVLIPPVVGLAVLVGLSFQWLYTFGAAFYAITIVLLATAKPLPVIQPAEKPKSPRKTNGRVLVNGILIPIAAMSLLEGARKINSIIFPLIVMNQARGTASDVGFLAGAIALLEIPMMLFWSSQLKRFKKSTIIAVAAIIYSVYLVIQSNASSIAGIYLIIPLNVIGASALMSINITFLQDLIPDQLGLSTSLISVTGFAGWAIASGTLGIGVSSLGYSGLSAVAGIFAFVAAVTLFALQRGAASAPEEQSAKT
ncbi:MFS family permease [Rhizobium leguminosarum]|uniref:MFS family permease n=1 Tax=Rhizobium leguminosarum TaxID=384 RepID=A0AAE2MMQ4_RHILE|nr:MULTISPECIES: MFS transporter [Rhizobium]MBB4291990.1 MFS family permease [Rhizobium leguminosarum]MBB4310072.1 MFS family permease [Rhizobium leguminosarum]MBB4419187.1 MFS family permease [Rhizobium leguminosarum]MBB4433990.1 MFS family permease [Rhizobium esperanzae]MBB4531230.1 MFS family permease [Rhizobium leguminosarum]